MDRMDSHKVLLIDMDNCVRCYSCQVACRQEYNLTNQKVSNRGGIENNEDANSGRLYGWF